jgi:hypothetical protein
MVETIMLVGEPSLNSKKPDEWIGQISDCVSTRRGLPKRLASGLTVGCLQHISDTFESVLLKSTLFDVPSGYKPKRKLMKKDHDGCIGCGTIHVRLYTTSSQETLLESGPGDSQLCTFHPGSAHFRNLLTLNPTPKLLDAEEMSTSQVTEISTVASSDEEYTTEDGLTEVSVSDKPTDEETADMDILGEVESQHLLTPPEHIYSDDEDVISSTEENHSQCEHKIAISNNDGLVSEEASVATQPATSLVEPTSGIQQLKNQLTEEVDEVFRRDSQQSGATLPVTSSNAQHPIAAPNQRERRAYFSSSIPARDGRLYGRNKILKQLEEILVDVIPADSNSSLILPGKVNLVWLAGLAGIGKTSIAKEFFYRYMDNFECVLWLRATSDYELGKYCHDSAIALGLVNGRVCQDHNVSRARLMNYLGCLRSRSLIILDDCREGVDVSIYIPKDVACSVIATGRQAPVANPALNWTVLDVGTFTPEEATLFFISYSRGNIQNDEAEAMCRTAVSFHDSPLLCRHVADRHHRSKRSFVDISVSLGLKDLPITARFEPVSTVMASTISGLDNTPKLLLSTLCFYDSVRIPERLVRSAQPRKKGSRSKATSLFSELLSVLPGAAASLWNTALVDIDESHPEKVYLMHSTVQDYVRTRLDDKTWSVSFDAACSSIDYQWPSKRKLKNILGGFWEDFDYLHTHVHHLADCLARDRLVDQLSSYDPGEDFKRLLIKHTW